MTEWYIPIDGNQLGQRWHRCSIGLVERSRSLVRNVVAVVVVEGLDELLLAAVGDEWLVVVVVVVHARYNRPRCLHGIPAMIEW